MRVPRTIAVVNSVTSLCSAITLDDDFLVADFGCQTRSKNEMPSSLSPIFSPSQERRDKYKNLLQTSRDHNNCRSQSEEHCPSMELITTTISTSAHHDQSHRHSTKVLSRRYTEPLPAAARKACLQNLVGYPVEDGTRKTKLVDRFSAPLPCCEDGEKSSFFAPPPPLPKYKRAVSDESSASIMPLIMPVRKASIEEICLA